jgi:hypothetical protein
VLSGSTCGHAALVAGEPAVSDSIMSSMCMAPAQAAEVEVSERWADHTQASMTKQVTIGFGLLLRLGNWLLVAQLVTHKDRRWREGSSKSQGR